MKKVITLILLYIFAINQASAGIFLYKIMPNTTDDKNLEYIEIYNSGDSKVSLEGYKLKDKSNKSFDFGYGEYIESNSSKKYYRSDTSILLNNSNEEIYFYDSNSSLIDSYSYSTSTKSESIIVHPDNTNSGSTQTGTTDQTNSRSTDSGSVENINLIYEFQNPSYIVDKTLNLEKYICDKKEDKCKINLNLENSFSGNIDKNNYKCEIDFGLEGWKTGQENSCNPSTITFPKGIFNIKLKIISKSDSSIFSEKSFILENDLSPKIIEIEKENIIYKEKSCSQSSTNSKTSTSKTTKTSTNTRNYYKINITTPNIQIQSGIKAGKCTKTDCNVNLIYEPKNKNEQCLWDFGNGNFKSVGTDKKCNPGYVKYGLGNHKITLKVFDKYNTNNYKLASLYFTNSIETKDKKINVTDRKIDIIDKVDKNNIDKEAGLNTEEQKNIDKIIDNIDKKENINKITNNNSTIIPFIKNNKLEKEKKVNLPYFMDNFEIPDIKNNILIQGRLGDKTLSGSIITCIENCSINLIAKDNKNIKEYLWDFGNGETFNGQNPSYVKYTQLGKYNISLTTINNGGIKNIEEYTVIVKQKPIKIKKKKVSKKKHKKKSKILKKIKTGIYMTQEKLNSNYIPKKIVNKDYIEKDNIGKYCTQIDYFPDAINKFKILITFLIMMMVLFMGMLVLKKKEIL